MSPEPEPTKSTREKMLDIAEDLIARRGPEDFRLQEVTQALGVTPPAFYAHFKHRDDLVASVARRGAEELHEAMTSGVDEGVGVEVLAANGARYIDFLLRHPAMARLILWDLSHIGVDSWVDFVSTSVETRTRIRGNYQQGVEVANVRELRMRGIHPYITAGAAAAVLWTQLENAPPGSTGPGETTGPVDGEMTDQAARDLEKIGY